MPIEFWSSILGVLVGSFITLLSQWLLRIENKKKDAYYLSLQITCVLRPYILDCLNVAQDNSIDPSDPDGHNQPRSSQVDSPKPPQFPQNINWASIDSQTMLDLFTIPILARKIEDDLSWYAKHESDAFYIDLAKKRQLSYTELTKKTFHLERLLTKKYNVSEADWYKTNRIKKYLEE